MWCRTRCVDAGFPFLTSLCMAANWPLLLSYCSLVHESGAGQGWLGGTGMCSGAGTPQYRILGMRWDFMVSRGCKGSSRERAPRSITEYMETTSAMAWPCLLPCFSYVLQHLLCCQNSRLSHRMVWWRAKGCCVLWRPPSSPWDALQQQHLLLPWSTAASHGHGCESSIETA